MLITSLNFAGFVLAVLALYHLLPRQAQNYLLLVASYLFYISWAWQFAILLLGVTLFNFHAARRLQARRQAGWLWAGIAVNVLVLACFKYANFFVPQLLALLPHLPVPAFLTVRVAVPVGLSFTVLQTISYLVDVHRKQLPAGENLADFALYLAYFPKLLAGPVERARVFLPKLAQPRIVDNQVLATSGMRIVVGAVRKLVVADALLALMPAGVFITPRELPPVNLTLWLLVYVVSLYNDFAGYTSLVRGVSGLFGIELSPNFSTPFFARNFSELWTRWHISFSSWLRDYVYFPLSRALLRRNISARHLPNIILPPVVAMLVSGLWHGASVNVLLWGGLMGVWQASERVVAVYRPAHPGSKPPWWRQVGARAGFWVLLLLTAVPFRMEMPVALQFWRALLHWSAPEDLMRFLPPLALAIPALALDVAQFRADDELVVLRWSRIVQSALLAFALLAIFLATRSYSGAPFVYQGF